MFFFPLAKELPGKLLLLLGQNGIWGSMDMNIYDYLLKTFKKGITKTANSNATND